MSTKKSKLEKELAKLTKKRKEIFLVESRTASDHECYGYCYGVDGKTNYVSSDRDACLDFILALGRKEIQHFDDVTESGSTVDAEDAEISEDDPLTDSPHVEREPSENAI